MKIRIREYRAPTGTYCRLTKLEFWCREHRVHVVVDRSEGGFVAHLERGGHPYPLYDAATQVIPAPRPAPSVKRALEVLVDVLDTPRTYIRTMPGYRRGARQGIQFRCAEFASVSAIATVRSENLQDIINDDEAQPTPEPKPTDRRRAAAPKRGTQRTKRPARD